MSIDTNIKPRVMVGAQADRPVTPTEDGLIYVSPEGISFWDRAAGTWIFAPGLGDGGGIQTGSVTLSSGLASVTGITVTSASKIYISLHTRAGTIAAAPLYDQSGITVGVGTGAFSLASVSTTGATNTSDASVLNWLVIG